MMWVTTVVDDIRDLVWGYAGTSAAIWGLAAAAATAAALFVRKWVLAPMNRVRLLGDVGYVAEEGTGSVEQTALAVRKRRLVGQVPPVYPNGWFCVIESRALAVAEAKNVCCLGKNLAVFRGEDGVAYIIDAYCPHMGANLAVGGEVKGNCIDCPFHGWRFRGDDGKCVHVPYSDPKHIPDQAKVTSYTVLERNGFVYMWHHAEGNEPDWEPPLLDEIEAGEWTYRGRSEHIINAHIEEIPENGADVAHLRHLHGPFMGAGTDLRYTHRKSWRFARHAWGGCWEQDATDKHIGQLTLNHSIYMFGRHIPLLDMKVIARQIGPGIVYLTFDSPFGRGAYLQALTPMEPLVQRMLHHIYFYRYTPTLIAKFFLLGEAMQVERDLMVWNNKKYEGRPVFVKSDEDSLIARHRRWYSQFYSENSPRLQAAGSASTKDSLDW